MEPTQPYFFDHEKLEVYQESISFIAWSSNLLDSATRPGEVRDQLDRASTSLTLNIAEGNGKYSPKDRCRFFDIAHGSALECAAALDVLVAKGKLQAIQIHPGKGTPPTNRPNALRPHQAQLHPRLREVRPPAVILS